jgi:uncharacterized protein YyaL (SSP411 family)
MGARKANRLIKEKSPYLLQHAYNPVDWFPWGKEAFEKAKREDKPVFLSIGYSTCHWCHVMEKESFENKRIADLLNRDYVAIKVDREERPDIDSVYMRVCQAISGHGGWPLTIIMTPDKIPFYAGTYLPPHNRAGLKGMSEVLPKIADLWKNERDLLLQSGQEIVNWLTFLDYKPEEKKDVSESLLHQGFQEFSRKFDPSYGGFAPAPKFPSAHIIIFLLRYYRLTANKEALRMAEKTLESIYRGGIYDHIGFGFSRYSTDNRWLIPHFEKMLYDNALLSFAYLEAYQATGVSLYARVATEVFEYILRDMVSPEGGFYSAEDADSEGIEGNFYLWEPKEIIEVLGAEDGEYFNQLFGITQKGNFQGRNIPNQLKKLLAADERDKVEKSRRLLFEYRNKRVHPYKDDKILTGWNGLMIASLAYGSRVLQDSRYYDAARLALDFIMYNMRREDGRLLARYRDKEARYPAFAADYAYLIWGLIELYEAGYDSEMIKIALELNRDLLRYFWDEEKGGLFLYGSDTEKLIARPKESYDGALPSENSVAAYNFLRLGRIIGDTGLEEKGYELIKVFSDQLYHMPSAYSFWLIATMLVWGKTKEIVVVGKREDEATRSMLNEINKQYLPEAIAVFKAEGEENGIQEVISYLEDMSSIDGKPAAYICQNYSCQRPITNLDELIYSLNN